MSDPTPDLRPAAAKPSYPTASARKKGGISCCAVYKKGDTSHRTAQSPSGGGSPTTGDDPPLSEGSEQRAGRLWGRAEASGKEGGDREER
jgi:hypothetical protein